MYDNLFVINHNNLDNSDMRAILSDTRNIPLSEMEKKYIDELGTVFEESIDIMDSVLSLSGNNIKKKDSSLYHKMTDMVEKSSGILNINTDIIGRGYEITDNGSENE
jgi:hypothetical protein